MKIAGADGTSKCDDADSPWRRADLLQRSDGFDIGIECFQAHSDRFCILFAWESGQTQPVTGPVFGLLWQDPDGIPFTPQTVIQRQRFELLAVAADIKFPASSFAKAAMGFSQLRFLSPGLQLVL